MRNQWLSLLILFGGLNNCFGQKIGEYYIGVPSGSNSNYRINFIDDSTVTVGNIPRHMSGSYFAIFRYISNDSTIEILSDNPLNKDSTFLKGINIISFNKSRIILTRVGERLIDYNSSSIYVTQEEYFNNDKLYYLVDGKKYLQNIGKTNGYGLVSKIPKPNKKLQKKITTIEQTPDKYSFEMLKGLQAYQKFGIKTVFGIIVIKSKIDN